MHTPKEPHAAKPSKPATSLSGLAYIEQYKGIAIADMEQYGIPASINLDQALLDSGMANSKLAREARSDEHREGQGRVSQYISGRERDTKKKKNKTSKNNS